MSTVRADLRRAWSRSARYRPATATGWSVAVTVAAYVVQLLTGGVLERAWSYFAVYSLPRLGSADGVGFEPWRMLTTALIHEPVGPGLGLLGLAHIGFNMYALILFGRPLEGVLGAGRLVAIYVLSVLAGSVAVLYAAAFTPLLGPGTEVFGASGGVFGVLGAVLAVQRRLGVDVRALLLTIGVNFAIPFIVRNVAWEAHLGGLVVGVLLGWLFISNRGPRRARRTWTLAGVVTVVVLVLALAPAVLVG